MTALLAAVIMSLIDIDTLLATTTAMNRWILDNFGFLFSWASFGFVLTIIAVFFSPVGRITIGGVGAKPILSKWNWFAITLCTTIAVGILFWATAEPLFHFNAPPDVDGLEPGSDAARSFAISSLYMHWSFTPYAIYTIPGLTFALAYYNLKRPYSLSGPLSLVIGRFARGRGSDFIDAVALFSLVAGIAASLGAGMLSISGGIENATGIMSGPLLTGAVTLAIVGAFVISSITGLQRGIRFLSDINTKFFFALAAFILIFGPTSFMAMVGIEGVISYITEFVPRSLGLDENHDPEWSKDWTVFYFANWLAWAPITGLFLGRIARGYSVRAFIMVNFIAPSLFAVLWMTIFGGVALYIDITEGGVLNTLLESNGPEAITYAVFDRYPLASVLTIAFLFLSFVSYVTAADSNTEAIASVCQQSLIDPNEAEDETSGSRFGIKITLALLIGATAWVMTAFSGVDGVRMLSNLGGFPALFIVIALNIALLRMMFRFRARLAIPQELPNNKTEVRNAEG